MNSFESDEIAVAELRKIASFPTHQMPSRAKQSVLNRIRSELETGRGQRCDVSPQYRYDRASFWRKKLASVAIAMGVICVGTGAVAWADGVNVLNVVANFVQNVTYGGEYGTGQSLSNTSVDISQTEGILTGTSYGRKLDDFLGTSDFPKLDAQGIDVYSIDAGMVNSKQQEYYLFVGGYVPTGKNQGINLSLYHNIDGTVQIDGQTMSKVKKLVSLSNGISATYVEITNDTSFMNYLTWKSGNWIFVLRSTNIPEGSLMGYAQNLEQQVSNQ